MLLVLLSMIIPNASPQKKSYKIPAYPKIWHQPNNAIINPKLCDTITLPGSYTMMMVYQSLQPDTTQQLWKLNRIDDRYYSIGTHAISTDESCTSLGNNKHVSTPCIYTLQHTIKSDTSYHDITQLYIGADNEQNPSHILLYEAAYFDYRLPLFQSLMFQTYLAIKYGITLDGVSYISSTSDTLWNAKADKEFYHRIHGIGNNSFYNHISLQSTSLEDSIISICSSDTLPPDNYILIGDNDAELSWQHYECDTVLSQRIWKMNTIGEVKNSIQIKIRLSDLQADCSDTLFLALLDQDNNIIQTICPDSIIGDFYCYTFLPYNGTCFSFGGNTEYQLPLNKSKRKEMVQDIDTDILDYVDITPNPTDGDFIATINLAEEKSLSVIIQDVSGKVIHYQTLKNIKDYIYKDRINNSGIYIITFRDSHRNIIATKELIVN